MKKSRGPVAGAKISFLLTFQIRPFLSFPYLGKKKLPDLEKKSSQLLAKDSEVKVKPYKRLNFHEKIRIFQLFCIFKENNSVKLYLK